MYLAIGEAIRIRYTLLVMLLALLGGRGLQAQPWTTALPSIQGGDYGNGAATSDVVGGAVRSASAARAPVLIDLSGHAGDQARFALSTGMGITL